MPDTTRFAVAPDGARIAWRADGPAGAPAVLFCTMASAGLRVWDSVVDSLSDRWLLVRHDRRGEGDSDPGAPETHSFDSYARDALAVLRAAGRDAAVVCGMAFGARVALRLALDHPASVRGLVLFDATGGPPAPEAVRREMAAEASRLRQAAGLVAAPRDPAWFERRDPAGAGLARFALAGEPAWTPGLAGIGAPTLVACGEQDPNFEGAQRIAREIPGAAFAPMPMTGHASILHRPELVLRLIRGFLEAGDRAADGVMAERGLA
jgi:3-oxoadipate enol-lactonase